MYTDVYMYIIYKYIYIPPSPIPMIPPQAPSAGGPPC